MARPKTSGFGRYECRFCNKRFASVFQFSGHFAECLWFRSDANPEVPWALTVDDHGFLKSNRIDSEPERES